MTYCRVSYRSTSDRAVSALKRIFVIVEGLVVLNIKRRTRGTSAHIDRKPTIDIIPVLSIGIMDSDENTSFFFFLVDLAFLES